MFFANASKMQMVRPENALPGRPDPLPLTEPHFLSGIDLKSPVPAGMAEAMFGMGCFWGLGGGAGRDAGVRDLVGAGGDGLGREGGGCDGGVWVEGGAADSQISGAAARWRSLAGGMDVEGDCAATWGSDGGPDECCGGVIEGGCSDVGDGRGLAGPG